MDAAEDPSDASENLANLIRLVRIDFGIRIQIDTRPLRKDANGLSSAHVAVGVIRYDDVDMGGVNGTFVFIRSSLIGDEPADLKNYAANNPQFPHHGTLDQSFDEDQFESYRMLGFHIGRAVFAEAAEEAGKTTPPADGGPARFNRRLFSALRREWTQVTSDQLEQYTAALDPWESWDAAMRTDPKLLALNLDMYPEVAGGPADESAARVAEMRAVGQLVGVMETAWVRMDLDRTHARPLERGVDELLPPVDVGPEIPRVLADVPPAVQPGVRSVLRTYPERTAPDRRSRPMAGRSGPRPGQRSRRDGPRVPHGLGRRGFARPPHAVGQLPQRTH